MFRLNIDGARHTGCYRCECDCGGLWIGQGEKASAGTWSPALPIAEAIVHINTCHPSDRSALDFSERFSAWLTAYWEEATSRLMHAGRKPAIVQGPRPAA